MIVIAEDIVCFRRIGRRRGKRIFRECHLSVDAGRPDDRRRREVVQRDLRIAVAGGGNDVVVAASTHGELSRTRLEPEIGMLLAIFAKDAEQVTCRARHVLLVSVGRIVQLQDDPLRLRAVRAVIAITCIDISPSVRGEARHQVVIFCCADTSRCQEKKNTSIGCLFASL